VQAADFLRDYETVELATDELGMAVMGKDITATPTEAERARACKVWLHL